MFDVTVRVRARDRVRVRVRVTSRLRSAFDRILRFATSDAGRVVVQHTSLSLDSGRLLAHIFADIFPVEPANMSVLSACEWTQRAPQRFWLKDLAL